MTDPDREFITEVRRGLILVIAAIIKRYGLTWREFMPRDEARMIAAQDSDRANITYTPSPEIWQRG